MSISIHGLDRAGSPAEYAAQLLREFAGKREATLQRLLGSGIEIEQVSLVYRADCLECEGWGVVLEHEHAGAAYTAWVRECRTCPGICVDGVPITPRVASR